ncbi:hypothetical protein Tco_0642844 [Tanacetum coccineum]
MAASAISISSDSSDESVGFTSLSRGLFLFGDIQLSHSSTSVVAQRLLLLPCLFHHLPSLLERLLSLSSPWIVWLCSTIRVPILIFTQMRSLHQSTFPATDLFHHSYSPILLRLPDASEWTTIPQDPFVAIVCYVGRIKAIPFGRPYRTHLNGPRKLLTARKRVGPLPARRLAWSRVSPHSLDHRLSSSSSSSDSLPVHSSGLDAPDQAHSGSSTRDVSPRLVQSSGIHQRETTHSSLPSAGNLSRKRIDEIEDCSGRCRPISGWPGGTENWLYIERINSLWQAEPQVS